MATLVILAAGIGSRYGGLKQLQPITDKNRLLMEYTAFDAAQAGFDSVALVIRRGTERAFTDVARRLGKLADVKFVPQSEQFVPSQRAKPLGTAHAIFSCKNAVKGNFAVVNADDYYGKAFRPLMCHAQTGGCALVTYLLRNTLSANGSVSRGICRVRDGALLDVTEVGGITADNAEAKGLSLDAPTSVNLWAFTPTIFDVLQKEFDDFVAHADLLRDEFQIPKAVTHGIQRGEIAVRAYPTAERWLGLTYRNDLQQAQSHLAALEQQGKYNF